MRERAGQLEHLEFLNKDTENIVICYFDYVDDVTCSSLF